MNNLEVNLVIARTWAEICSGHAAWWLTWTRAGNKRRAATALARAIEARDQRNRFSNLHVSEK